MPDQNSVEDVAPRKINKNMILLSFSLFTISGGAAFAVTQMGLIGGANSHESAQSVDVSHHKTSEHPAFVKVPPVVANLTSGDEHHILRFSMDLEVAPRATHDVEAMMPRIVDMLNQYLRAVDVPLLEQQHATLMVRRHLLARTRLIVGEAAVHDVLIQEFVLN